MKTHGSNLYLLLVKCRFLPPCQLLAACRGFPTWYIEYLCVMHNAGEPMIIKKAVCMHEEDYGTLWKHTEYRSGHSEVRRSRRLVLSFISTIANYEYGFYWYFYQVWPHSCLCTNACAGFWYACCPGAIAESPANVHSSEPTPLPLLHPPPLFPNASGALCCILRCFFRHIYCLCGCIRAI